MMFHKMSPRTHQYMYDYLYFVTKSLNPRNNCGTHFCSTPLLISKVLNYCQTVTNYKIILFAGLTTGIMKKKGLFLSPRRPFAWLSTISVV